MPEYSVVVGNVGQVYRGKSKTAALKSFNDYVKISKSGRGRAGNESVDLYDDFDVIKSYYPPGGREGDTWMENPHTVIPSKFTTAKVRQVRGRIQILLP